MELFNEILEEIGSTLSRVDEAQVEAVLRVLEGERRVFVDGEGRSGLMAKGFAMRLMHLGYTAFAVGETITPAVRPGDVFVAVSGSGTGGVENLRRALEKGCVPVVVTGKADSPLARLSDTVLVVPGAVKGDAGAARGSVQLLSSLFDQSLHIVLDAVCLLLSRRNGVSNEKATSAHW